MNQFYRCIKLKAHFQDTRKQANIFGKEYRFKSKSNKNGVPAKPNHTIDKFMEATKKINVQLMKTEKFSYNNQTEKELDF